MARTITVLKPSMKQSCMNIVQIGDTKDSSVKDIVSWSDKELKLEQFKDKMLAEGVNGDYIIELAELSWAVGYDAGINVGYGDGYHAGITDVRS